MIAVAARLRSVVVVVVVWVHSKDRRKDSLIPSVRLPWLLKSQGSLPEVIMDVNPWQVLEQIFEDVGDGKRPKENITNNVTTRLVTTQTYLFLTLCWGYPTAAGIALYVVLCMGVPGRICPHVPMEVLRVLSAQAQLSKTLSLNFVIKARCEPRGKFADLAGFFLGCSRFWRNLRAALMDAVSFFLSCVDISGFPFTAKSDC